VAVVVVPMVVVVVVVAVSVPLVVPMVVVPMVVAVSVGSGGGANGLRGDVGGALRGVGGHDDDDKPGTSINCNIAVVAAAAGLQS